MTLDIRAVSKSLGGVKILDSVSFCLATGELVGLVGPNGAGKTTLIRVILGLLQADEGQVLIDGLPVATAESRAKVCYCLDNDGLYPTLTGTENLRFFRPPDLSGFLSKGMSNEYSNLNYQLPQPIFNHF